MPKIRNIKPGPLPSGPLKEGEVLLAPTRWRWILGKYLAPARVLANARSITSETCRDLLSRRDLSFRTKMARIKAELTMASTETLYAPETLHGAGFRRAECVCGPGQGHHAPKPARRKVSRKKSRRE